jgi:putative membrane protein insertion efficiency factor
MTHPTESSWLKIASALLARAMLGMIRLYQLTLSPVLPVVFGPNCGCRFHPTCSHYAMGAIRSHGAVRGAGYAIWRLLKCTPLHPGGLDPVPPVRSRVRCDRVSSNSASASFSAR